MNQSIEVKVEAFYQVSWDAEKRVVVVFGPYGKDFGETYAGTMHYNGKEYKDANEDFIWDEEAIEPCVRKVVEKAWAENAY